MKLSRTKTFTALEKVKGPAIAGATLNRVMDKFTLLRMAMEQDITNTCGLSEEDGMRYLSSDTECNMWANTKGSKTIGTAFAMGVRAEMSPIEEEIQLRLSYAVWEPVEEEYIPSQQMCTFGWVEAQEKEEEPEPPWVVDVKGNCFAFEISVVRSENRHGRKSYGWCGEDKILISSARKGDSSPLVFDMLKGLAAGVAEHMNNEEKEEK